MAGYPTKGGVIRRIRTNKVFLYGSLRLGEKRGSLVIPEEEVVSVHEGTLAGQLYRVKGVSFPAAKLGWGLGICGEVVQLRNIRPILKELDRIEGVPTLYVRDLVETEEGEIVWVYAWNAGERLLAGEYPGTSWPRQGAK